MSSSSSSSKAPYIPALEKDEKSSLSSSAESMAKEEKKSSLLITFNNRDYINAELRLSQRQYAKKLLFDKIIANRLELNEDNLNVLAQNAKNLLEKLNADAEKTMAKYGVDPTAFIISNVSLCLFDSSEPLSAVSTFLTYFDIKSLIELITTLLASVTIESEHKVPYIDPDDFTTEVRSAIRKNTALGRYGQEHFKTSDALYTLTAIINSAVYQYNNTIFNCNTTENDKIVMRSFLYNKILTNEKERSAIQSLSEPITIALIEQLTTNEVPLRGISPIALLTTFDEKFNMAMLAFNYVAPRLFQHFIYVLNVEIVNQTRITYNIYNRQFASLRKAYRLAGSLIIGQVLPAIFDARATILKDKNNFLSYLKQNFEYLNLDADVIFDNLPEEVQANINKNEIVTYLEIYYKIVTTRNYMKRLIQLYETKKTGPKFAKVIYSRLDSILQEFKNQENGFLVEQNNIIGRARFDEFENKRDKRIARLFGISNYDPKEHEISTMSEKEIQKLDKALRANRRAIKRRYGSEQSYTKATEEELKRLRKKLKTSPDLRPDQVKQIEDRIKKLKTDLETAEKESFEDLETDNNRKKKRKTVKSKSSSSSSAEKVSKEAKEERDEIDLALDKDYEENAAWPLDITEDEVKEITSFGPAKIDEDVVILSSTIVAGPQQVKKKTGSSNEDVFSSKELEVFNLPFLNEKANADKEYPYQLPRVEQKGLLEYIVMVPNSVQTLLSANIIKHKSYLKAMNKLFVTTTKFAVTADNDKSGKTKYEEINIYKLESAAADLPVKKYTIVSKQSEDDETLIEYDIVRNQDKKSIGTYMDFKDFIILLSTSFNDSLSEQSTAATAAYEFFQLFIYAITKCIIVCYFQLYLFEKIYVGYAEKESFIDIKLEQPTFEKNYYMENLRRLFFIVLDINKNVPLFIGSSTSQQDVKLDPKTDQLVKTWQQTVSMLLLNMKYCLDNISILNDDFLIENFLVNCFKILYKVEITSKNITDFWRLFYLEEQKKRPV